MEAWLVRQGTAIEGHEARQTFRVVIPQPADRAVNLHHDEAVGLDVHQTPPLPRTLRFAPH
jgi:hypothetical protein